MNVGEKEIATAITSPTGFGIFQHGGFGEPHVLGIVTLLVLAIAAVTGKSNLCARTSAHVETHGAGHCLTPGAHR